MADFAGAARSLLATAILIACGAMARPQSSVIECKAARDLSCDLNGCASAPGDTFYVSLTFEPAANTGDLCTFTYCRAFTLYRFPATDAGSANGILGATRSDASGSTEDLRTKPALDYVLWIAPDLSAFTLFNSGGGSAGGWAGPCAPK